MEINRKQQIIEKQNQIIAAYHKNNLQYYEMQKLESSLNQSVSSLDGYNVQKKQLVTEIRESQKKHLNRQYIQKQQTRVAFLEIQNYKLLEEIKNQKQNVQNQPSSYDKQLFEKQRAEIQEQQTQNSILDEELNSLQKQNLIFEDDLKAKEYQIQAQQDEQEQYIKQIQEFNKQKHEREVQMQSQVQNLLKEMQENKQKDNDQEKGELVFSLNNYKSNKKILERQQYDLQIINKELELKVTDLEQELLDQSEQINQLQGEMQEGGMQEGGNTEQLITLAKEVDGLNQLVADMNDEIEMFKKYLSHKNQKVEELQLEQNKSKQEFELIMNEKCKFEEANEQLQEQIEELQQKNNKSNIIVQKKEVKEVQIQTEEQQKENINQQEIEDLNESILLLTNQNNEQQQQLNTISQNTHSKEIELQQFQQESEQKERKIDSLQREVETLKNILTQNTSDSQVSLAQKDQEIEEQQKEINKKTEQQTLNEKTNELLKDQLKTIGEQHKREQLSISESTRNLQQAGQQQQFRMETTTQQLKLKVQQDSKQYAESIKQKDSVIMNLREQVSNHNNMYVELQGSQQTLQKQLQDMQFEHEQNLERIEEESELKQQEQNQLQGELTNVQSEYDQMKSKNQQEMKQQKDTLIIKEQELQQNIQEIVNIKTQLTNIKRKDSSTPNYPPSSIADRFVKDLQALVGQSQTGPLGMNSTDYVALHQKVQQLIIFREAFQNNLKKIKSNIQNAEMKICNKLRPLHKKLYVLSNQLCQIRGVGQDNTSYRNANFSQNMSITMSMNNSISRIEKSPDNEQQYNSNYNNNYISNYNSNTSHNLKEVKTKEQFNADYLLKLESKLQERKMKMDSLQQKHISDRMTERMKTDTSPERSLNRCKFLSPEKTVKSPTNNMNDIQSILNRRKQYIAGKNSNQILKDEELID